MFKVLKISLIILFGLTCGACVNSPAVHKLNQIAFNYLNDGQVDKAISRLEASVELDPNIYETRYNLAVVYMQKKDCKNAYDHIVQALKIVDDEPAAYYTHAVASMCLYDELIDIEKNANDKKVSTFRDVEIQLDLNKKCINVLKEATASFDMYTRLAPSAEDTQVIVSKIRENNIEIERREQLETVLD